jgi:cytochrome b pre-mRNA-processing protein 3
MIAPGGGATGQTLRREVAASICRGGRDANYAATPERRINPMRSLLAMFRSEPRVARPLYDQVVARARATHWYRAGGVPDTIDGRFAALATLLALVDLRLERGTDLARKASVSLAECFIEDMDGELRQIGIGDPVMSKKVGGLVSSLGGRVGAWRRALDGEESWDAVIARSLHREQPVPAEAAAHAQRELRAFWAGIEGRSDEALINGALP